MEGMSNWGPCVKVTWAGRTGKLRYRNVNRLEVTVSEGKGQFEWMWRGCPGIFRVRVLESQPSDDLLFFGSGLRSLGDVNPSPFCACLGPSESASPWLYPL